MNKREVKPLLNWKNIIFEIIVSLLVLALLSPVYIPFLFSATLIFFILFLLFISFPLTLSVFLIGNRNQETGSFWFTFLGTILGLMVDTSFFIILNQYDNYPFANYVLTTLIFIALFPVLGAVIGFNLTRRHQKKNKRK